MPNGIVATSVLPGVLGALVGATALVVGVWLTAYYTQRRDIRRYREGLTCEAFSDFLRATAQNAFAREERERIDTLVLAAHAKARLVTFGDSSLVSEIRRFDDNGADTTKQECQAAIVAAAQRLRSTNDAPGMLTDEDVRSILFGGRGGAPTYD